MKRSQMRELIMVILYQIHIYESKKLEVDVDKMIFDNALGNYDFINICVKGVMENITIIDETANKYMQEWTIDRIDKPGSEILRLAFYELMFTDTPKIAVINEAVELAKKYSDDAVRKLINAALDKYVKEN